MELTITGRLCNAVLEDFSTDEMNDLTCLTLIFDRDDYMFAPSIKFINLPFALAREIEAAVKGHLVPPAPTPPPQAA